MAESGEQIISGIVKYVTGHGGDFRNWYVGITEDLDRRLFEEHNVSERRDQWIACEAASNKIARYAEGCLIQLYNMRGGEGGGHFRSRSVYAYRVEEYTVE